jgi:HSP20 family protein
MKHSTTQFFSPDVDILRNEKEYLLVADLPGMVEDEVSIAVHEGRLSLEASKADGKSGFRRAFRLSEDIDQEHIDATMNNGVLKIRMAKVSEPQARRIAIQGS